MVGRRTPERGTRELDTRWPAKLRDAQSIVSIAIGNSWVTTERLMAVIGRHTHSWQACAPGVELDWSRDLRIEHPTSASRTQLQIRRNPAGVGCAQLSPCKARVSSSPPWSRAPSGKFSFCGLGSPAQSAQGLCNSPAYNCYCLASSVRSASICIRPASSTDAVTQHAP